jgi:calcium-translocating P-type ATPase
VASLIHLLHGVPFVKNVLRRLLGRRATDLALSGVSIASLTFANYPLALIFNGVESLVMLNEVTARRAAWRRYEDSLDGAMDAEPGAVVRLEAGMTVPRAAVVIEGTGTATSDHGLPLSLTPGETAPAGATVAGGPFVLELQGSEPFEPQPRPAPLPMTLYDRYLQIAGLVSIAYAAQTAIRTASVGRAFEGLLLLNPRTAVIGLEAANLAAAARVLRAGLTVIGTRPNRVLRLPTVVLLDGPRLLTEGMEIAQVLPPSPALLASEVLDLASIISAAAGSPWGNAFPRAGNAEVSRGTFNGLWATATVDGVRYILGPPEDADQFPMEFLLDHQGGYLLELRKEDEDVSLGLIALQLRLHSGVTQLVDACRHHGVILEVLLDKPAWRAKLLARRAGISVSSGEAVTDIHRRQRKGAIVAFVSDNSEAAAAFAAADLAIGIAGPRSGEFPARADVLAPDLRAVADLIETAALREVAIRDSVFLSVAGNAIGAVLGLSQGPLGIEMASLGVYLAALTAIAAVEIRLQGGHRPGSSLAHLSDPRPERWGRRAVDDVLGALKTSLAGLTDAEALRRRQAPTSAAGHDSLLTAIRNQFRTPITSLLAGGACLTLVLNQPLNTALISLTITLNVVVGVWQEREVGRASEALRRLGSGTARVLREQRTVIVKPSEVVVGDVLILGPGDHVAADARMLSASGLEVDEAALTGESLPVAKGPNEFTDTGRIVLEGSDVIVGTGRAVVVAVGRHTRLGATAVALTLDRVDESPMGVRLGRILKIALPLAAAGGAMAGVAGLFYGSAAMTQLTVGVTTALSAIPEGLPLLAGVGQAGVASRLAQRQALVHRVAAVEALGRVDVACTDKTGTMTEGHLVVRLLVDADQEAYLPESLPPPAALQRLLLTAALASPHPDVADAVLHPTDLAIVSAAMWAGLIAEVRAPRLREIPFDSARAFHASLVQGRLCVKGAPERLIHRCTHERCGGGVRPLDPASSTALLDRVTRLAERGLRVLMVAEGPPDTVPNDPQNLTVLGFVGISDPLRKHVPEAVRRCHAAGIRVLMLTGDHPATARAIAREAGLFPTGYGEVLRASDLADLSPDELDERLETVVVVARAAPLDKLRIIESLRRRGHVVAMTGDGVNDAPSLRLADVGVAMGKSGTEVARQAADVVLTEDDFATLVEAMVEGRGFWANMRTALGLLLGGNAGELGLIVGGSLMGFGPPLTPAQILMVNMITDALPCLAVVLQRPEHRNLAGLAREGLSALDTSLRRDVVRRGLATCLPSLGSYLLMQGLGGPQQATSVAFTSVVATQLAQTLDAGRVEGSLSRSVVNAVAVSAALLVGSVTFPPISGGLGLVAPSLVGWGVIGGSAALAVLISRAITALDVSIAADTRSTWRHGDLLSRLLPKLVAPRELPVGIATS